MHPPPEDATPDGAPADARVLSSRVAAGDEAAFTLFYQRWQHHVEHAVQHALHHDNHRVPDVTQEVFMRVIRKMPVLDTDRAIGAWLTTTSRRCAVDAIRTAQRARRNDALERPAEESASADDDLDRAIALLGDAEAELRALIEARVRFGWTLERIGRAFGITPSAADGRIKRGLARMRETLHEGEGA